MTLRVICAHQRCYPITLNASINMRSPLGCRMSCYASFMTKFVLAGVHINRAAVLHYVKAVKARFSCYVIFRFVVMEATGNQHDIEQPDIDDSFSKESALHFCHQRLIPLCVHHTV